MTDYAGKNVTITLEQDALILTGKGFFGAGKELNARLARRIPFGAIREVSFKDAGFSDGLLWLTLGADETPAKISLWKATDNPDAVIFKPGKQAKAMRELHSKLNQIVSANRASGVDPASVPFDLPRTGDEILHTINHNKVNETALRPDVANAARALANVHKATMRMLEALPSFLKDGEKVEALTSGASGSRVINSAALLVMTERRVFTIRDGAQTETDAMPRPEVTAVVWDQGLTGRLEIVGSNRSIELRGLDRGATASIVNALRN